MSEPAKDTAIEITPKTETSSVRVPRIVAEINRVASRVRDRNKKEEEDIDDAEVLENDAPTPSPKPADIQIIRENTHPYPHHIIINGCLRSICYAVLLTALIYVCVILQDVRRYLYKLNNMSVSSQLRSLDETLTNLSGNLTTSIADLEATVVNISDSISNVTQVNSFLQETFFSFTGDVTLEVTRDATRLISVTFAFNSLSSIRLKENREKYHETCTCCPICPSHQSHRIKYLPLI